MTVPEWLRRALRGADRTKTTSDIARKRAAIRQAACHDFPAADVDQMLEEIERGYNAL